MTEEMEKSRVLQEALHALATEHHELEQTLGGRKSPARFYDTDDDEFYDCEEEEEEGDEGEGSSRTLSVSDSFKETYQSAMSSCDSNNENNQHNNGQIVTNGKLPSEWLGRDHLPVPMFDRSVFSIWSILKQCIGKELSKITMPVIFNEPLSFIQRITEYMEYAKLLEKADLSDDPVERMTYVAAFVISSISSNRERTGKPFNPLLGETYELERPDLGFKIVGEQVSHHPPVSAFHVESPHFRFHGTIHPKLKFWGKSVEINPKGLLTVELLRHNEAYSWQNVNCCIHNVIVGKLWVEHYGVCEVTNHRTQHKAVLNFKQGGWFGKDLHRVEGMIYDGDKNKMKALYGSWVLDIFSVGANTYERFLKDLSEGTSSHSSYGASSKPNGANDHLKDDIADDLPVKDELYSYNLHIPDQKLVWKAHPRPHNSLQYFSFTTFSMMLNEMTADIRGKLAPTDARLRPDIRQLEEGHIDAAADEKNRMEEKQRTARKERRRKKEEWRPRWFHPGINQHTGKEDWLFNGEYWNRDWTRCPDIF